MHYQLVKDGKTIIDVMFDINDEQITFPVNIDVEALHSNVSECLEKLKDQTMWFDFITSLHYLNTIQSAVQQVMTSENEPQKIQENFVDIVENLHMRVKMLSYLLTSSENFDFTSGDDFVRIMFWPLVDRIMDDANKISDKDSSSGSEIDMLQAEIRRDLFRGIVHDNENSARKMIDDSRNVQDGENKSDDEFFQFVTDLVDEIVSGKMQENDSPETNSNI